jgi:hypothetical protein
VHLDLDLRLAVGGGGEDLGSMSRLIKFLRRKKIAILNQNAATY